MSHSAKRYTKAEEAAMRAAGLRPVTTWIPDLSDPVVAQEFRRQAELAAKLDTIDPAAESFSEAAQADLDLPPYENG